MQWFHDTNTGSSACTGVVGATPASLVMARPLSIQCIFISFVPTLFSYVLPGEDPVLSFVIVLCLC